MRLSSSLNDLPADKTLFSKYCKWEKVQCVTFLSLMNKSGLTTHPSLIIRLAQVCPIFVPLFLHFKTVALMFVVPPKGISHEKLLLSSVSIPDTFNLRWRVDQMAWDQTTSEKQVISNPWSWQRFRQI